MISITRIHSIRTHCSDKTELRFNLSSRARNRLENFPKFSSFSSLVVTRKNCLSVTTPAVSKIQRKLPSSTDLSTRKVPQKTLQTQAKKELNYSHNNDKHNKKGSLRDMYLWNRRFTAAAPELNFVAWIAIQSLDEQSSPTTVSSFG